MQIYGILAHPAGHSFSPAMHNAAFRELGINARFRVFDIPPGELDNFFIKVRKEKIAGLAVSIPYKEKVIEYLDRIDDIAENVGAVNTVYWKGDNLCGTNTDVDGFLRALREKCSGCESALIFGVGGAARAVVYGLQRSGVNKIAVWARDFAKASAFAEEFGCLSAPVDFRKIDFSEYRLLVNCTPVGMYPIIDKSVLPAHYWLKDSIAYDLVMNPRDTRFLNDAKKYGATGIYGSKMLLYQGVKQFEIWHGVRAPEKVMEKALSIAHENRHNQ